MALNLLMRASTTDIVGLDQPTAVAVGQVLAASGTSDITDAHAVITATSRGHAIATGDASDLASLAPDCDLIEI